MMMMNNAIDYIAWLVCNLQPETDFLMCHQRVILNCAIASTSSIHLHPAHFNLQPAPCNTLNNIWTKILHITGQFPQI